MKIFCRISLIVILFISSSCAMMMNDKNDTISISSTPSGADIFIDGRSYGKTPATITIEAKNQTALITKEGHGSTQLKLESWATIKNGKCMADALGSMLVVPYYSLVWSGKCNQFKKREYSVNIPYLGAGFGRVEQNSPMMGMGQNPASINNYYYNNQRAR